MATEIEGVRFEEEFILNKRGIKLYTCRWLPVNTKPKALVFLCHGYAMECSISMKGAATRLVKAGYEVHGIDNEGHGKSAGLQGYIPCFDDLVNDCSDHFTSICEKKENKRKVRILLGESMGGGMVLRLHMKKPDYWDGGVLVAPMCKISEDLKPNPVMISVFRKLSTIIPTWKIVPGPDMVEIAFRDPEIRKEVRANPLCYKGKFRVMTANQLYDASLDIENRLHEVTMPFLVLHGELDRATDPSASKLLYELASSPDKTLKLYPGMWHSLSYGELPENLDIVFTDIIQWLDEKATMGNSRLEREQKLGNDDFYMSTNKKLGD